ncbi:probable cytochrome P450 49a1 isoform X2 [Ylistrum balloti]|uniref:probable cytochrome P450 49a1 isoform X2 n=1 Tax=Ylistrum balloti TaxID=509963 RepID=UPI00290598E4|nr:probable cytochrome P450 49a1 isoform X2 [Ylistrum balloti]
MKPYSEAHVPAVRGRVYSVFKKRSRTVRLLFDMKAVTAPCCRGTVTATSTQSAEVTKSTGGNNLLDIPGPGGIYTLPYIGMRLMFKPFSKYDLRLLNEKMVALRDEYGPIVRIRLRNMWSLYLFDPDDIEKVFRADQKYPERAMLPLLTVYEKRQNIPSSLSNTNGEEWYSMRSPTQKIMLRPKAVTKYAPKLSKIADDFVEKLDGKDRLENLPFKLMEYSAEDNTVTPLMAYTKDYLDRLGNHFYKTIPSYMFFRTKYYKDFEKSANFLYSTADEHINKTLKLVQQASEDGVEYESNLLFDLLSTPGLTTGQVRRTITDVFIGGIDSTANSMTFLLFYLAKHQDKQERLFKDLCEHVLKRGEIQEDTINKIPYLKACLKESFRMVFPITGGTVRILDKDITLQGYNVPKGTPMQLCSGPIGRDEKYFPEQDQFIPERWIRGDTKTDVNPFAHLPFGFGPRKCIGQRFAEQEIYICTAKLLRNYRVVLPPGVTEIPYFYSIFATPREPTSFILEKRQD